MERHMFLAVPIPKRLQNEIPTYAARVKPIVPLKKWTSEGDYHITLNFLGAVSEGDAHSLSDCLRKQLTSFDPFELELNGVGVFGNERTPRVSWVGVKESSALLDLYKLTSECCSSIGFETSSRPYRPHITLGKRWGGGDPVTNSLPKPERLNGEKWTVDEVILYEIHPQKNPKYIPFERYEFGERR